MPYVNIKVTREGVTREQKADLIAGVTEVLVRVLQKDPETTHVVIDEIDLDNWGLAGLSVPAYRERTRS
jgi:4-oxalocrotonate tautomerase